LVKAEDKKDDGDDTGDDDKKAEDTVESVSVKIPNL